MLMGVSAVAWPEDQQDQAIRTCLDIGYDYIEAVYSRIPDGINVYAIQGVFYQSGIDSFSQIKKCIEYLINVADVCKSKNIKIVTIGAPSMRKGNNKGLIEIMKELDPFLDGHELVFCIEPNARKYGADYYWSIDEIVNDIHNFKNIKTMIDTGSLMMENIDSINQYVKYKDYIHHVHFSAPQLTPIENFSEYRIMLQELQVMGYNSGITYELKASVDPTPELINFMKKVVH